MKAILSLLAVAIIAMAVFVFLLWHPPKKTKPPLKYYIGWESDITGFRGQGSKSYPKQIAVKIIDRANCQWPDIEHYIVEAITDEKR